MVYPLDVVWKMTTKNPSKTTQNCKGCKHPHTRDLYAEWSKFFNINYSRGVGSHKKCSSQRVQIFVWKGGFLAGKLCGFVWTPKWG